jgi:hypothetical protein
MRWLVSPLILMVACGPTIDDSADSGGDGGSGSSGVGESESESSGEDATGEPEVDTEPDPEVEPEPELEGIEVVGVSHSYQCIDGCEGFYWDDFLTVQLRAERDRTVMLRWHDWTIVGRELVAGPEAIDEDTVSLPAGEVTSVSLTRSGDGFCNEEGWSEPAAQILLEIDGILIEVEGSSNGGMGWDC